MNMEERIKIAGFGGQGVQSMGMMLAYAAMVEGKEVSWLPSYGPEMRGGTSSVSVVISDSEIGSPMVTSASCVMVLNAPSMDAFEPTTAPGKWLLVNSSLITRKSTRTDIKTLYIPCNEMATELGNPRVGNMIMLGAYLQLSGVCSIASILKALPEVLGKNKAHLIPINEKALQAGAELAAKA